jgi:hypothetical protein
MPSTPYSVAARWDSRNLDVLLARLGPKQMQFATALMLTRTGGHVKAAEEAEMPRAFDRPTPFTLHSVFLKPATKSHLEALVWFKDWAPKGTPAGEYLKAEVFGGERKQKRFEKGLVAAGLLKGGQELVPASGVPLDAFGNVPRTIYNRILSQLHAQNDRAQNETARSRARNPKNRSSGGRYFFGDPGHRGIGIWERFTFAVGSAIRPVFIATTPPVYHERFAFFSVAEQAVEANYMTEFDRAADETQRTAR